MNNEIHSSCRSRDRKRPGIAEEKNQPARKKLFAGGRLNYHWVDWIKSLGRVSLGLLQRGVTVWIAEGNYIQGGGGGDFCEMCYFREFFRLKRCIRGGSLYFWGFVSFSRRGGGRVGGWYFRGLLLSRTRNFYVMCYRGKHAGLPPIRRQANKSSRTWCRGFARPLRHRSPGSLPICYHLRRTYWNTSRRCKLMVLILGKMVVGFLLRKNHKKNLFQDVTFFNCQLCKNINV